MNLDHTPLECERLIEYREGERPIWNSYEMLEIASDLQRLMENQRTDPHLADQLARAWEELRALYAENKRLMEGKQWVTYRMEDGSDIYGEYAWVTDTEFFEESDECRVIKETWRLVDSEVVVFNEWVDDEDDDGITLPVQDVTSSLLSGEPGLGDSVRNHPAGGPLDSRPDAQPFPEAWGRNLP
jgi:hypothetical protein